MIYEGFCSCNPIPRILIRETFIFLLNLTLTVSDSQGLIGNIEVLILGRDELEVVPVAVVRLLAGDEDQERGEGEEREHVGVEVCGVLREATPTIDGNNSNQDTRYSLQRGNLDISGNKKDFHILGPL